ncbi:MAG TPA: alpha/beta hydrolase [Actinomycetota bacterium]|nr:alpha/beta hydrolase [Actinomycetota bacterium]
MRTTPRRPLASLLLGAALLATACTTHKHVAAPSPGTSGQSGPTATASDTASPSATTSSASPSVTPSTAPSSPGSSAATPAPPSLSWHSCSPGAFQCTTLAVPLDWSHAAGGATVRLSLIRLPASGAKSQRIGSLLVNPGGPGASAVDFARQIPQVLPDSILRRFDIVAFDPRGMGGSSPLACENGPGLDAFLATNPNPQTPAEIQAVIAADQQFAAGCAKQYGTNFLAHIDTQTAARDMDYIRAALGEDKLTYVGYSYGTFLGAQYADLFPNRVRAFVLDGAVDPSLVGLQFDVAQAVGFDKELGDFFNACVVGCPFYSGGDPKGAFMSLMSQVAAQPLQVGNRQLTLALFLNGVADALYTPSTWPDLQTALAAAAQGNGSRLLALSDSLTDRRPDGSYDALTSALSAVNCVDSVYPTDVNTYKAEAAKAAQSAPVFGAAIVWGSLVCAYWPVPASIHPGPVHATGAPPILVIGTTADPATPYQWAEALASQLSSGVLLTHVGEGHTSLGQGSGCVDNVVVTYLLDLTPPAKGSVCSNGNGPPSQSPSGGTVAYRP